jgi:RNA recognition motif-containing protein
MKLFVGGLSEDVTEEQLRQEFSAFGTVESAAVVTDRFSGQPRGFGFVEMPIKNEAIAAITGMNGKEMNGRTLEVNEARPPAPRGFSGNRRPGGTDRSSGGPRDGGRNKKPPRKRRF